MLITNADIAQEGAHHAQTAVELDGKYRIHTRSQSSKSLQEKAEKAEAEAGESQGGIVEAEGSTPAQTGASSASDAAGTSEGSDESMAEQTGSVQDTERTSEITSAI